uniref:WD repeat-containing protein n=3 Tax=Aegilops tauschii subsp. strangulata TaxID=200361 RepID=A0A453RVZ5_AEGTS
MLPFCCPARLRRLAAFHSSVLFLVRIRTPQRVNKFPNPPRFSAPPPLNPTNRGDFLERLVLIRVILGVIIFGWIGAWNKMDEFELEDNLEFILQSIQELIEDQGENNPFGEVNQNELLANLVNYDQDNLMPDVSVEDVVNGKDVQGIPWEKMLFPRDQYREMKMKGYKNYQNLSYAREDALQDCKQVERDGPYYDFQYNTRRARLSIVHFQLRNLVWATTKHDVYTVHNQSMTHWSSLNQISTELINGDDCIIPKQRGHGSQSVSMVQFTTMAVDNDLLVVGGFHGELICKRLEDDGIVFSTRVTDDENAITNSLEIYQDPNGSRRLVVANNDCSVRIFDTKYFDLLNHYVFPWSVNSVSVNPDGTLFAVLGDHEDGLVVDPKCGKMAIYWLPGVKTQHVGCGTLETYHNPWLSLVEG